MKRKTSKIKKLFTIATTAVMAVTMAAPVFADSYKIQSASNNRYWNVSTYNGSVSLFNVKMDTNGCYWYPIYDADGSLKLQCPYTGANKKTLVASANGSSAGSNIIVAAATLPNQHSSIDFHTISGGLCRIYFNKIGMYAYATNSYAYIDSYSESSQSQKWYRTA